MQTQNARYGPLLRFSRLHSKLPLSLKGSPAHLRRLRFRIVGSAPSACLFAVFAFEAWYQERSTQLPPATFADVVGCVPVELSSYDKFPRLTRALLEKGYSAQDIEKVYGGNLLRVMRAVEQRARELKDEPPIESSIDRK